MNLRIRNPPDSELHNDHVLSSEKGSGFLTEIRKPQDFGRLGTFEIEKHREIVPYLKLG